MFGHRFPVLALLRAAVLVGLIVGVWFTHATWADEVAPSQASVVDFGDSIRPILTEHCMACHGGVKQVAGLTLATRGDAIDVIEPGDANASPLIERVESDDPDFVMPPPDHGVRLSSDEVQLLRRWIDDGAAWELPWAYEPPVRPASPQIDATSWCRDRTDAFVLSMHAKQNLQPSAAAAPNQWLRRATFDLTGLPPTVAQQDDFAALVNDRGDAAYRIWVDRLIADPRFGERWASVWLDQVRYADSMGLGLDGRRQVWKYRDWVIRAINDDLPFDEFTIKQLAGDLLPSPTIDELVATTANRLTQSNEEGGTDDEEFRISAVIDRVSTTWQTWQGITFGCVQCHSHPYDPIQHDEFYKFAAFFNNTADSDLNEDFPLADVPLEPQDEPQADRLDAEIRALTNELWQTSSHLITDESVHWRYADDLDASADQETRLIVETVGDQKQFATVDTVSRDTTITLRTRLADDFKTLTGIRLTVLPRDRKSARSDSEWGFVLSGLDGEIMDGETGQSTPVSFERVIVDEPFPFKDPNESLNWKSNDGFSAYSRIHHPRSAVFVVKPMTGANGQPVSSVGGDELVLRLSHKVFLNAAFPMVMRRGTIAVSDDEGIDALIHNEKFVAKESSLRELKQQRKAIASVATPVMTERLDQFRRPTHVFEGGLFLTKGVEVQPDIPSCFPPLDGTVTPNRLAMAKWIVGDQNPLTARVIANRVWARLFGQGLVASEEDFGSSGQKPSHPDLLDDLAIRFRDEFDWSVKRLVRSIVLSGTYRQDASADDEAMQNDASNRWLARGPRFRLPAELVRDAALSVSGLLANNVGGPPVHPPIPDGVWTPFQGSDQWNTPPVGEADRYRRTIYTYTKRSIPFPMQAAFDAPSREFCSPRRLRSNTPIQALMMLNDVTFVECAAALATAMEGHRGTDADKFRFGFRSVATRDPNPRELRAMSKLHEDSRNDGTAADAMFDVATVLLNLDEAISK